MICHFLFEQSGTFKNVLKENGYEAFDYDILNDFGQTDFQIDLFEEIEKCYDGKKSIFDSIKKEDFVMAFFPCTHFCQANSLLYSIKFGGREREYNKGLCDKLIQRNTERAWYFELYLKFCYIIKKIGCKCIIENPGTFPSFLQFYSPFPVSYMEKDRSMFGDVYKKPTIYIAINFEMKEDFAFYTLIDKKYRVEDARGMKQRSMISKLYAENFYKRFLQNIKGE